MDEVLAANREFYRAFAARDLPAMEKLWAARAAVACIHPGWDALSGRAAVLQSWRDILGNPAAPRIRCRNETAISHGEIGLVLCHEVLPDGMLVATNLFVREDDAWKMIHHQASPLAVLPAADDPAPPAGRLH
jgi:ketosteroid isomerase-like protein